MKLLFTLVVLIELSHLTSAQEFSFQLYFEDSAGDKDTLTLGYDNTATDSIDGIFGEINISAMPFESSFEARISNYNWPGSDQYIVNPTTFHLKKQIKKKDCTSNGFPLVSAVSLIQVNYPLKVSWDSSLFSDSCRLMSLITDWHPGGWFDAVHGGEQGPFDLSESDTVVFTHTTNHYITSNNDTLDVLYFTLASVNNSIIGINNMTVQRDFNIYPNPTTEFLIIQTTSIGLNIENIQLFDLSGKEQQIELTGDLVDLSNISDGLYFLQIKMQDGQTVMKKIIKK